MRLYQDGSLHQKYQGSFKKCICCSNANVLFLCNILTIALNIHCIIIIRRMFFIFHKLFFKNMLPKQFLHFLKKYWEKLKLNNNYLYLFSLLYLNNEIILERHLKDPLNDILIRIIKQTDLVLHLFRVFILGLPLFL